MTLGREDITALKEWCYALWCHPTRIAPRVWFSEPNRERGRERERERERKRERERERERECALLAHRCCTTSTTCVAPRRRRQAARTALCRDGVTLKGRRYVARTALQLDGLYAASRFSVCVMRTQRTSAQGGFTRPAVSCDIQHEAPKRYRSHSHLQIHD